MAHVENGAPHPVERERSFIHVHDFYTELGKERRAVKRKLPRKPCVRCGKPTSRRRDGRPTCLTCWVVLTELDLDKKMREMGKLKGTHGPS